MVSQGFYYSFFFTKAVQSRIIAAYREISCTYGIWGDCYEKVLGSVGLDGHGDFFLFRPDINNAFNYIENLMLPQMKPTA